MKKILNREDFFEAAMEALVDMVADPGCCDRAIEVRAESISMAFGPARDDLIALAMVDVMEIQSEIRDDVLRVFPDFCRRRHL
jgi:hypothetical protein